MTRGPDWGMLGRTAVVTSLVAAVVLFFALPDQRWIAGVMLALAVLDALLFWGLMPRLQGGSTGENPSLDELEQMNAEAEAEARTDEDWEKRPEDVKPRDGL